MNQICHTGASVSIQAALLPNGRIVYLSGDQQDRGRFANGRFEHTRLFDCTSFAFSPCPAARADDKARPVLQFRTVVRCYNKRGTTEQWGKEWQAAVKLTRLSCHPLRPNQVRLWLIVLAYNLGNRW